MGDAAMGGGPGVFHNGNLELAHEFPSAFCAGTRGTCVLLQLSLGWSSWSSRCGDALPFAV